eukprot:TRINITY_DN67999_c0_g1_i1.p1 TRINITY_DN67999_c0_g1~~TRINITY_DN67999_c0_g1_i1.p1  ORF type:complete len:275 (+),score=67.15 TRINITY_DN67999_c0_g1_i1:61-825(+)
MAAAAMQRSPATAELVVIDLEGGCPQTPLPPAPAAYNSAQLAWQARCLEPLPPLLCGLICRHRLTDEGRSDSGLRAVGGPFAEQWEVLQVTVRFPFTPLSALATLYGFVPFILVAYLAAAFLLAGSSFCGWALALSATTSMLNEVCFKPLFSHPRPDQAACTRPGFPSGHVLNAYALLSWFALELLCCSRRDNVMTAAEAAAAVFLVGPTPWARAYTLDHTRHQVSVSVGLGMAVGAVAHRARLAAYPQLFVPL